MAHSFPNPSTLSVDQCNKAIAEAEALIEKYRQRKWLIAHGRDAMYISSADLIQDGGDIVLWDDLHDKWFLILPENYSKEGNYGVCKFLLDNGWVEPSQLDCERSASHIFFGSTQEANLFVRNVNHWIRNAKMKSVS
jgi:hypothetical protein